MEKLGVQKEQLVEELQAEYSRLRLKEHDLQKTSAPAPARAMVANEMAAIKEKLDLLSADKT